jgi:hypothetical protein
MSRYDRVLVLEIELILIAARGYPRDIASLAIKIGEPRLLYMAQQFLFEQLHPDLPPPLHFAPFHAHLSVFHSAIATYYAPSDSSGVGGMHRDRIRSCPSWRNGPPRYDCLFAEKDPELRGMRGLHVAQVILFFSFTHLETIYPCALVRWFIPVGDEPCETTGLWMLTPDMERDGQRATSIIHLDSALRGAHLIAVYGDQFIPRELAYTDTLDAFNAFYVNKLADHHTFEIAF